MREAVKKVDKDSDKISFSLSNVCYGVHERDKCQKDNLSGRNDGFKSTPKFD